MSTLSQSFLSGICKNIIYFIVKIIKFIYVLLTICDVSAQIYKKQLNGEYCLIQWFIIWILTESMHACAGKIHAWLSRYQQTRVIICTRNQDDRNDVTYTNFLRQSALCEFYFLNKTYISEFNLFGCDLCWNFPWCIQSLKSVWGMGQYAVLKVIYEVCMCDCHINWVCYWK